MSDEVHDFEREKSIDPDNLHEEWFRQPNLVWKYSKAFARADALAKKAKERIKVVMAQLDAEIRRNPGEYGIEKITDKAIEAAVYRHPKYWEIVEESIDLKEEANLLDGALNTLEDRREALKHAVRLFLNEYWGDPHLSNVEGRREWKSQLDDAATEEQLQMLAKSPRLKKRNSED